jgi:transposase
LTTTPTPAPQSPREKKRGRVLDITRELLAEGRNDEVMAVVSQLLRRNEELDKKQNPFKTREGIGADQVVMLLDGLVEGVELEEANQKLRDASGIDELAAKATDVKPAKPQPTPRKSPPANLRRVENLIPVPENERPCPQCGKVRDCIGHDITEVVDLIPAEVIVRVDKREKVACGVCEAQVQRAPVGDKVVPGGAVGTTLVANILVDKYRLGLPLHRQKEQFERRGYDVAVSTLADQVTWGTDLLRPLWRAALAVVLEADVMHLDSTGLSVLDKDSPNGIKLGSLWGYVGVDGDFATALYLYTTTGKKKAQTPFERGPEDVLKLREGFTVADAATLYDSSFKRPGIIECGCNMHSRRYFVKAADRGDARAGLPLAAYKKLYDIEAEIRGREPGERLVVRQANSKPLFDELASWCRAHKPSEPPSSPLGAGIRYLLNNEEPLRRFLDNGNVPIDNGIVERLHVRTALTRKNYLFAGSDAGAERAAIAYTLIGSCQLAEVDPVKYLADIMPRMTRRIRIADMPALLPAQWKAARSPR